jgi:alpha,alpha-trehalase
VPTSFSLSSICTTSLAPVDLNAFMYQLELSIARLSRNTGDSAMGSAFEARAAQRRLAVDRLMWNSGEGAYFDIDWQQNLQRNCLSAATVAPLFTGLASRPQALAVADTVRQRLMAPGGLATTEHASGQQWDRPNGWAPLQWMAVTGFENFGLTALASDIRQRWLTTVQAVFEREGKLVEKYALRALPQGHATGGGGGEYPLQDGFGWTNGVTRSWLEGPS